MLELRDIDRPAIGDGQVLVRVAAAAVAGDDWHLMRGRPWVARPATGLRRPRNRVPGREVAGRVEAVGRGVTRFRPGDEVVGWGAGALAEYAAIDEGALVARPARLSAEQAAVMPVSGFTALQALRDAGRVEPGQWVLVIGASGGVGTFAVQIAKALGARVAGVASTSNLGLVRSLGADEAIDYTRQDPTGGDRRYDLIVDLVGASPLRRLRRALTPYGTLVMVGGTGGRVLKGTHRFLAGLLLSPFTRQRLRPLVHRDRRGDLETLLAMASEGTLTPVVAATYPLARVPEAIGHFDGGHATGKVAITVTR